MIDLEKQAILIFVPMAVGFIFRHVIALIQKDKRLSNLAGIAIAAEDAVDAVTKTLGENAPASEIKAAALTAAKASVVRDLPGIEKSLEAELDVLLAGHVEKAITAPGGATVSLP